MNMSTTLAYVEGFVTASVGYHLVADGVAWPLAYLIGAAGGIALSAIVKYCQY
jgi:hypothetical protein